MTISIFRNESLPALTARLAILAAVTLLEGISLAGALPTDGSLKLGHSTGSNSPIVVGNNCYQVESFAGVQFTDINNIGVVLGRSSGWPGLDSFTLHDGEFQNLGLPLDAEPKAINDLGLVVGYRSSPGILSTGFLLSSPGNYIEFESNDTNVELSDINNEGEIVGSLSDSGHMCTNGLYLKPRLDLTYDSQLSPLECTNSPSAKISRINDRGSALIIEHMGPWYSSKASSRFVFQSLSKLSLGDQPPFTTSVEATDINDANVIVGSIGMGLPSPFRFYNGALELLPSPLNHPGATFGEAVAINSRGDTIGTMNDGPMLATVAFINSGGATRAIQDLICPGSSIPSGYLYPVAINDSGVIIVNSGPGWQEYGLILRPVNGGAPATGSLAK